MTKRLGSHRECMMYNVREMCKTYMYVLQLVLNSEIMCNDLS